MRRTRWGLSAALVVAGATLWMLVFPEQGLSQAIPIMEFEPDSGQAGSGFDVIGEGFPVGHIEIRWGAANGPIIGEGDPLNRDGEIEIEARVPSDADPGTYDVLACQPIIGGPVCDRPTIESFEVIPPPTTTSATTTTFPVATPTTSPGQPSTTLGLGTPSTTLGGDPPATTLPTFSILTTTSALPLYSPETEAPFPDLQVTGIEVTQATQNLDNLMPLVANRHTWVRVYVRTDGEDITGVKALLRIQKGGEEIVIEPDWPYPKEVKADGGDRAEVANNFAFLIPNKWTDPGTTNFTAYVYWDQPLSPYWYEPDAGNNYRFESVVFREGNDAVIYVIRMEPGGGQASVTPAENNDAPNWMGPQLVSRHPIANADFYPIAQALGPSGPDPWDLTDDPGTALDRLEWLRAYWDIPLGQWLLGYIHDDAIDNWAGFGRSSSEVGVTIKNSDTMAHESGHITGLDHVPCKDTVGGGEDGDQPDQIPDELLGGDIDVTHPNGFPNCQYADTDPEGYYGIHAYIPGALHPTIYPNDPSHPEHRYPLMGYLRDRWIDPHHYCDMLNYYGITCDPAAAEVPNKPVLPTDPVDCTPEDAGGFQLELCFTQDSTTPFAAIPEVNDLVLVVNGTSEGDLELAVLEDPTPYVLQRMESNLEWVRQHAAEGPGGATRGAISFKMEIAGANGEVLLDIPLASRDADAEGTPLHFFEFLPYPPGARVISLFGDDLLLVSREVSGSPPQVTLLSPNGGESPEDTLEITWDGSDPDGDDLSYTVLYSADGGDTFQPIVIGSLANGHTVAHLDDLPGSENGVIKIIASDGVNTASDTSDGPITIPGAPPKAAILGPEPGATYPLGGRVLLEGTATDREDGVLTSGFTWSSDIDGVLGSDPRLEVADLSPGVHEMTLDVVDSDGDQAQAHVHIKVEASVVIPPTAPEALSQADLIFARYENEDFSPMAQPGSEVVETPQAPEEAAGPGVILLIGGAALVLLAGSYGLWRSRRRSG